MESILDLKMFQPYWLNWCIWKIESLQLWELVLAVLALEAKIQQNKFVLLGYKYLEKHNVCPTSQTQFGSQKINTGLFFQG